MAIIWGAYGGLYHTAHIPNTAAFRIDGFFVLRLDSISAHIHTIDYRCYAAMLV